MNQDPERPRRIRVPPRGNLRPHATGLVISNMDLKMVYGDKVFQLYPMATKSHVKHTSITTNKTLKAKYNSNFIRGIQP